MVILRDQLAHILGVANKSVIVTSFDVGGGFGIKNGTYPEYPALMLAARQLGRTVRWTGTRAEAFMTDAQARDSVMRGRLGLDREGRFLALDIKAMPNLGAYVAPGRLFHRLRQLLALRARPLPDPGRPLRSQLRLHQYHAHGAVSRRRPAGSGVDHRKPRRGSS